MGVVYDGPRPQQQQQVDSSGGANSTDGEEEGEEEESGKERVSDIRYTTSLTSLSAHWSTFRDPHSPVLECWVAVGTCEGCSDTRAFRSVGLATESTEEDLRLAVGTKYHFTVRCCNAVGLCSQGSSDGVVVDPTPPVPGRVWTGGREKGDGRGRRRGAPYQASRFVCVCTCTCTCVYVIHYTCYVHDCTYVRVCVSVSVWV